MVEGGAQVIKSFLSSSSEHGLVDTLVVTVAPVIVGAYGVGYADGIENIPGLRHLRTEVMGRDTVVGMKVVS